MSEGTDEQADNPVTPKASKPILTNKEKLKTFLFISFPYFTNISCSTDENTLYKNYISINFLMQRVIFNLTSSKITS